MTVKKRPNVVGKGPSLSREMLDVFKAIENSNGMSGPAKEQINVQLSNKREDLGKVLKMAYLKTVKAGETAWDLKEKSLELQGAVQSGDEDRAMAIMQELDGELDQFLHKIKTFVVRMT
jgi:hypothetical protein